MIFLMRRNFLEASSPILLTRINLGIQINHQIAPPVALFIYHYSSSTIQWIVTCSVGAKSKA